MRSYDVSYVPASAEEWSEVGATVEMEVKSDRLRLVQSSIVPVVMEDEVKKKDESTGEEEYVLLWKHTFFVLVSLLLHLLSWCIAVYYPCACVGFGVWETVSVRLVDDAEEERVAAEKEQEVRAYDMRVDRPRYSAQLVLLLWNPWWNIYSVLKNNVNMR